ncbi:hypothetical protein bcCo53_001138 (plasmid) [Borrelia coriaceae]|uniref:Lipoprotein n=1 Tax=Borrelia coriaceae ATCC 43381 TaxID=1408429 RepID=W5SWS9_9SPIR|nr:hypothetical protein [Borrelia coriaceae]AHH11158.1 hypothetical protein BCO_0026700 [Borrelia coriaceae ATCC 43381]UPA16970.1 hypothetical protein bcCo53_001138 [Borrelia coriaceae]
MKTCSVLICLISIIIMTMACKPDVFNQKPNVDLDRMITKNTVDRSTNTVDRSISATLNKLVKPSPPLFKSTIESTVGMPIRVDNQEEDGDSEDNGSAVGNRKSEVNKGSEVDYKGSQIDNRGSIISQAEKTEQEQAYRAFLMRVEYYKELLNPVLDSALAERVGFDPSVSFFDGQKVSRDLEQYVEHSKRKNMIYVTLDNDVGDIQIVKKLVKELDVSIPESDHRYLGSETQLVLNIFTILCSVTAYAFENLNINLTDENLALIGKKSASSIRMLDVKLDNFIILRKEIIGLIRNKLYAAIDHKENNRSKERMMAPLRSMVNTGNGRLEPIIMKVDYLRKNLLEMRFLIGYLK